MMFRIVATAALALTVSGTSDSMAAEQGAASSTDQARAEQVARGALAQQLQVGEDSVKVTRATPRTWNDSSMGCGKPGSMALTVITEGYAVTLDANGRVYQVHVSGDNAVVCDKAGVEVRRDSRGAVNARGLDVMMEKARHDLAARLGVDPATIRLDGVEPQSFVDSGLGCPALDETVTPGPVAGFLLSMKHDGRVYTYHTDRKTLRPCPPIEAQ